MAAPARGPLMLSSPSSANTCRANEAGALTEK
jgi:hypothetical protein